MAGDVSHCSTCFRAFHAECSTKAKTKLSDFHKKGKSDETTKPNKITPIEQENNKETTNNETDLPDLDVSLEKLQNCLNQTAAELVAESQQLINDVSNNSSSGLMFVYDESICSICNLAKFDIECGMDKEEMNHLLGFLLLRIKSWVSIVCMRRSFMQFLIQFSIKMHLCVFIVTVLVFEKINFLKKFTHKQKGFP